MIIRVIDIVWPSRTDIDPDRHLDVAALDGIVKRCVASATGSLKGPASRYSELQTAHISWMFEAMGFTHVTIRSLLTQGTKTPACVDALALARLQLEALYSVCLMVQDPSFVDIYVKSFWRDNYVRFLLVREECKGLRRFDEYLNQGGPGTLEMLRQGAGVTNEEKATVEFEELGTPLPVGTNEAKIRPFPVPLSEHCWLQCEFECTPSIFRMILSAPCTAAATIDSVFGLPRLSNRSSVVFKSRDTKIEAMIPSTRLRPSSI
jgi:hypothetical protein